MESKDGVFAKIFRALRTALFVAAVFVAVLVYCPAILAVAPVSRKLARKLARLWNRQVLAAGGIRVKVSGAEKLNAGERYVFISNHQSALDIPIIYVGIGERISFIAKKELFMIPFFGWGMWAVGHTSIDRQNARKAHASIVKAVQRLNRENVSLILFPEGTRSKDGKVLEFKTASFTLALQAGVKLVPVAIRGAIDRLPPKSSRIVPGEVELALGNPIAAEELPGMSKGEVCGRVRAEIVRMVEGE
jgi:1-acyl-sn-glycerol-3-phosphate acyltransferase